jgi:3-methyladenine DNA glycosylase AlkD
MDEPDPTWDAARVVTHLWFLRDEAGIEGMARFGIDTGTALGISNTALRAIARQIKRNHGRSVELWGTDIREARLLAAFTAEPRKLTLETARAWAWEFNSWEIVDGVCDLFAEAKLQDPLIEEFAADEREFVRRAAFTMMALSAVHMKKAPDSGMLLWLPLIDQHASDPRNFVKKAVNWALRQIGKRSLACHGPALALAERLAADHDRTRRWIGKDAVRELSGDRVLAKINR